MVFTVKIVQQTTGASNNNNRFDQFILGLNKFNFKYFLGLNENETKANGRTA